MKIILGLNIFINNLIELTLLSELIIFKISTSNNYGF